MQTMCHCQKTCNWTNKKDINQSTLHECKSVLSIYRTLRVTTLQPSLSSGLSEPYSLQGNDWLAALLSPLSNSCETLPPPTGLEAGNRTNSRSEVGEERYLRPLPGKSRSYIPVVQTVVCPLCFRLHPQCSSPSDVSILSVVTLLTSPSSV
jgi:hypothetical protein